MTLYPSGGFADVLSRNQKENEYICGPVGMCLRRDILIVLWLVRKAVERLLGGVIGGVKNENRPLRHLRSR